jgi:hypothetical protein
VNNTEHADTNVQIHTLTAVIYGTVIVAALVIGLYGFFSLLWLAGNALQQGSYATHF